MGNVTQLPDVSFGSARSSYFKLPFKKITKRSTFFHDMLYLLTAIGLSPGGSSTVHIYTQTIHRTTQNKQYNTPPDL